MAGRLAPTDLHTADGALPEVEAPEDRRGRPDQFSRTRAVAATAGPRWAWLESSPLLQAIPGAAAVAAASRHAARKSPPQPGPG